MVMRYIILCVFTYLFFSSNIFIPEYVFLSSGMQSLQIKQEIF